VTAFLLDTNVIVEPQRRRPETKVVQWLGMTEEATLFLSAFTFAELRKGIA
jgi:predicted nucleic acid-binding protein